MIYYQIHDNKFNKSLILKNFQENLALIPKESGYYRKNISKNFR